MSLQTAPDKPCIRFEVEDTGIGISPDKQEVIFESFTQADGSTTRKFGGTGLGLAITKQLAELLDGRLTLTSQPGKGSAFSLTIPAGVDVESQPLLDKYEIVQQMNRRAKKPKTVEQVEFTGHVLVAEDAAANQRLIEFLLEGLGLQVTIVEDGQKAVQAALSRAYDLIFMDMQMPNMNGYEATKCLKDRNITTPIVALTAYAMSGDEQKCLSAGCDDYLSKPVSRRKLLRVLSRYISSENETVSEKIDVINSQVGELNQVIVDTVSAKAESDSQPAQNISEEKVIDWADLMNRCHDVELGKEIVELFLADSPAHLKSLAEAVKAANAVDVKLLAHTIKGSAAAVGAKPLQQAALQLELAAGEENLDKVENLFANVQTEYERLKTFLSRPDWVETAKQQGMAKRHVK